MKRKLLPISLLCLFGLLVVGCNNNNQSQAPSADSTPTSEPAANVAVTGVTLDQASATVLKGSKLTLTATVAPADATNKGLVWSSSDEDVATVSHGVVTAVEVGQANIKVKTKDGNFEAVCVVTVEKEITSVTISNKAAFDNFIVDDSESLNLAIDPEDNVAQLLAAGAISVTSSDPTVASVAGLTVSGLKEGTTKITVNLFGKSDEFDLTVGAAIPGTPYSVKGALDKAIEEAKFNGKTGKDAAITTTCFELTGKLIAVAPNATSNTSFNAILDDGTEAVYLMISKKAEEEIPVKDGDWAKVTCKLTNYYGLFEGVSRKAATGKNGSYIPLKDIEKIAAPADAATPKLNEAEDMTGAQYDTYYTACAANGVANATKYSSIKYAKLAITYSEQRDKDDKGAYAIDGSSNYGLAPIGAFEMDAPVEGHKSTVKAFLVGVNSSKSKSNGIVTEQTPLAPTAVVIDQKDPIIVHDGEIELSYTTTPAGSYARKVVWSSDAEANATVDQNGLVKGIYHSGQDDYGTANIKVKLGEGDSAIEATTAVKVYGGDIAATAAEVNATAMVYVGKTVKLTATTTPAMVSDLPQWSSSDETIATVNNKGVVTGVKKGTATITVKYNNTVSASCLVLVEPVTEAAYSMIAINSKNSAYASTYDVTFEDGKVWNIPGNQTLNYGTKIGGKLSEATDRALYSKSTYGQVAGLQITHGSKDSAITVNSLKLYVYAKAADAAEGDASKAVETVIGTFVDKGVTAFKPAAANGNWDNKYFRIVYNLSSSAASSNKGVVLTELKVVFEETKAKPIGSFSGQVTALNDDKIFLNIALGDEKAYVELGQDKLITTYLYDKFTGVVTIVIGDDYGNLTATYDPATNTLKNVGIDGTAKATLKDNGQVTLTAATLLCDCNGSTSDLQAMFKRRYNDPWTEDTNNSDRFTSVANGVAGSAMKVRAYAGGRYAFCLKSDIKDGVTVSNIGFWVYNDSNKDVTLRMWIYKATGMQSNAEIGNVTAKAGGWTYCRMGFTSAKIYNFQIADFNKTGVALVFDNLCLF